MAWFGLTSKSGFWSTFDAWNDMTFESLHLLKHHLLYENIHKDILVEDMNVDIQAAQFVLGLKNKYLRKYVKIA